MAKRRTAARRVAAIALALAATVLLPQVADAADDERGRPWARGTIMPSVGFGFGYSRDLVTLGFGVGASYYVANGFSLGLQLDDQILLYSSQLKSQLPGIEDQIPTNVFRMTPVAQWVFVRRPRFSPYIAAGVGPVFFNNDNGVHGQWTAGPGAYIGISGPIYLDVGVGFSGMFPTGKCNRSFDYQPETGSPVRVLDFCSFRWGPRLGIVVSLGGRSKARRERKREPSPRFEEPPQPLPNPMDPAEPEPEPESEPAADPDLVEPAADPVLAPPVESADAPPPSEPPPVAPPEAVEPPASMPAPDPPGV